MTVKLSRTPLVAGLAAVGLASTALPLSGCKADAAAPATAAKAAAAQELPTVTLATPRAVQASRREEVTGTLFPSQALQVGFEVGGRLERVRVKKGQTVQEGQVLAQLNAEIADAQLAQAQASVAAAEVAAAMAADVAGRNAKLQQQGNVSDVQNLTSTTQAKQAEAQLMAAKAQLAQAQAGRRKHDLRAPFAGTVTDAPEQVGAIVGPGAPQFSVENLGTLLLKTTVAESLRAQLKPGTKVRVEVIGGGASTDEAVIRTIIPSADQATRRIPVDILVPNKDGRFVANTLARVILPLGDAQDAQSLPATALSSSGGDHVYVVAPSGEVRRVDVQVLERGVREVVVKAAAPLDKVIEYPTPSLTEGTRVSVK
ncbi:efflux RND transporter periplasmic adaptor subunit [Archangium violaceum]|uniref:efflux RND transporter periplasmic adaptor subunit n=1 Tax=Archangium violaceum TaxID=83451 RepID=UPI00193B78BE|nr:efflux RND transporter periplasmic adaptor subunit [Archangium violaceum]QRK12185.1 efflux RND transporter periplasmic adaptor subunit [Archangium violaceum]